MGEGRDGCDGWRRAIIENATSGSEIVPKPSGKLKRPPRARQTKTGQPVRGLFSFCRRYSPGSPINWRLVIIRPIRGYSLPHNLVPAIPPNTGQMAFGSVHQDSGASGHQEQIGLSLDKPVQVAEIANRRVIEIPFLGVVVETEDPDQVRVRLEQVGCPIIKPGFGTRGQIKTPSNLSRFPLSPVFSGRTVRHCKGNGIL